MKGGLYARTGEIKDNAHRRSRRTQPRRSRKHKMTRCRRVGVSASLQPRRTNSEGQSNIAVARFLDMPRRIAQERVPTASNVGSREVLDLPRTQGQLKYCRFTFFETSPPHRIAQERVPTASNAGSRDVTGLPTHTSDPLSRLFACFAGLGSKSAPASSCRLR